VIAPTDLEKPDALKRPCSNPDRPGAVRTRLRIGQIQVAWTSVTSGNVGGHSMLENRHFSGVENSSFGIERRELRAFSEEEFFLIA
jgi:hypothetical protein